MKFFNKENKNSKNKRFFKNVIENIFNYKIKD